MKIAVLGDVHGHRTPFETVIADVARWQPEVVVSTGDIVNRGPSSPACLALLEDKRRQEGWLALRGNHEDYVIYQADPEADRTGPAHDSFYQSYWTYRQLGCDIAPLLEWDIITEIADPAGGTVRVTHGSTQGISRGLFPDNSDADLVRKAGLPRPAVFAGGHTHVAFIRRVEETLFVNAGSVGIPFDGDWRAGYARLTWLNGAWNADIVRLAYDRDATIREYQRSGFLHDAGPIAWLVLAEFLKARSQLFQWHRDYFDAVRAGRQDLKEAVIAQLERQGLWEEVRSYL